MSNNNTNETMIDMVASIDELIPQDVGAVETSGDAAQDAGTNETTGKAKREKLPEYRQLAGMPAEIVAIRPVLVQMLQDAICKLNADSVEPNTPENLKFIAKVGHHGVGVSVQGWVSGDGLSKDLKAGKKSYEFNASLRAIHEQDGTRSGYTAKQRSEAAEVLMYEDYTALLDAKVKAKTFKNAAAAAAKIPYMAWCKQKRANMTVSDKNADDVNAANKARLDAWNIRIEAKCAEMAQAEPLNLDDIE